MVLAAYEETVKILFDVTVPPIHIAAGCASVDVVKIIAGANISNLLAIEPDEESAAHRAVARYSLETLQYIHSVMPELLLSVDKPNRTPIHNLASSCDVVGDEDDNAPL